MPDRHGLILFPTVLLSGEVGVATMFGDVFEYPVYLDLAGSVQVGVLGVPFNAHQAIIVGAQVNGSGKISLDSERLAGWPAVQIFAFADVSQLLRKNPL